jgi:hypothetical protein
MTGSNDVAARVEALVVDLLDEPMLDAALGARELFFSNMLAFLCRRYPKEACQLLEPWLFKNGGITLNRVRREYLHLDLVIEFAGYAPLVIENKFSSLPDEAQLARYTRDALGRLPVDATLVLLSLADPRWPHDRKAIEERTWTYVSYRELAVRLGPAFARASDFGSTVLVHVARLADSVARLVDDLGVAGPNEPFTLPARATRLLASVRLDDAIGKIRGSQVMKMIEDRYTRLGIYPTKTEVGMSRGLPLLSAYWGPSDGDQIGWQQQGKQWRLAMILRNLAGRDEAAIRRRERYADERQDWFSFDLFCQVLGVTDADVRPRVRGGPEGWQRYNPDFVYRYRLLPATATVEKLVELAEVYGRKAEDWTLANVRG